MEDSTYHVNPLNAKLYPICHLLALLGAHHILQVSRIKVKIGLMMSDGFKVGNGLSQGDRLAPTLFNIALEHVRQLSVGIESTIFYKSVQLTGYADDTDVVRRTAGAISEAYGKLKERTKEVELNLVKKKQKTKAMVHNRKTRRRRISELLTVNDNGVEIVRSVQYLGSVIDFTSDETEDIKVRILLIKPITVCIL
jgi:hypothetical protein